MRLLPIALILMSLPCAAGANWPVHNRTTFERSRLFSYLNFGQEGRVEENKEDPTTLNLLIYRSQYDVAQGGGRVKVTLVYTKPYRTPEMPFHSLSLNMPAFKGEPPVFQETALEFFFDLFPQTYAKEIQPIKDRILAVQKEGEVFKKVYRLANYALLTVDVGKKEVFLNLCP